MGDYNIDLLKYNSLQCIDDFVNIMYNKSFRPLIDKPTRIRKKSVTLIDNILTNVVTKDIHSGIFYSEITDHLPIFQIANLSISPCHRPSSFFHVRKMDPLNLSSFQSIFSCDVDEAYNSFLNIFKTVYDHNFVVRKVKKRKLPRKPRITPLLLKKINKKYRLYKTFCQKRNDSNECKYKKIRNKFNSIVQSVRKKTKL